ncbi:MAG: hypothetical protein H7Y17_13910 [Chlorobia bacterium]|nr:hypothetical protein [Fimbriimonadaceae bacterium]
MDQAVPDQSPTEARAELLRLAEKLASTDDPDIVRVLQARISELETFLRTQSADQIAEAVIPAETTQRKLSAEEEADFRKELARASQSLYSQEDPDKRAEIQIRIKELQGLLGIDVAKLAGGEMSANAIPDLSVAAKPKKDKSKAKPRTDLAELQALVAEKSAQVRKIENQTEIELPLNPEPPTPEQMLAAEKLIQQARVEKMRGNKQEVRNLLEEAVRTAPGSPTVLEMLGDDHSERKQIGKALAYYRRAAKLDPKNVNLERKVAMSALGVDATSSRDQQMKSGMGGGLDDSAIPMASRRAALLISLFLPGLGHVVVGKVTRGWITLGVWCLCLAWVILMGGDVAKLGAMIAGGRSQANMVVVLPLLVMVVLYIATLVDFKGEPETARVSVDRPRPPVNLPFE